MRAGIAKQCLLIFYSLNIVKATVVTGLCLKSLCKQDLTCLAGFKVDWMVLEQSDGFKLVCNIYIYIYIYTVHRCIYSDIFLTLAGAFLGIDWHQ